MNRAKLNRINRPRVKVKAPTEFMPADRVQFLAELKCWAEMKGYKPGWPSVQYKERFSVWPAWGLRDNPAAVNVGAETMAWVNQRKREWQKAKRKEEERRRAEMGVMPGPADDYIELGECRV